MERRSRSSTRGGESSLRLLPARLAESIGTRPGGDSRTLSPERSRHQPPAELPPRAASYNQYLHGPPPKPPPKSHHACNKGGERIVWEYHQVVLSRVPGYGFGIAVSGGRDNPHFTNGDASIAISDVLKSGPAEGKLLINDRVISANSISLENVDYATAVQVLRDSGQTVHLVVKRRVVLPPGSAPPNEPTSLRVSLSRRGKKEDFGVVLGCRIYIKEITPGSCADKEGTLKEGDLISKINSHPLEGLSLKEARKLVESAKDKLDMILKRDPFGGKKNTLNGFTPKDFFSSSNVNNNIINSSANNNNNVNNHQETEQPKNTYSSQNLYVQPPSRSTAYQQEEKNNLLRASHEGQFNGLPPRPPQVDDAGADYGTSTLIRRNDEDKALANTDRSANQNNNNLPYPRYISFQKAGSVGIRLTGGNDVGIFVTAVQPGSPASQKGLQPGDKILKVNDMDMKGVTREEAVLFLLSLQDTIDLIAQYRKEEYDSIVSLQRGDSFYIKAHFNYEIPEKNEMSFRKSDVFHVVDTLHNGVVGAWQVFKMDPFMSGLSRSSEQQVQKGVIPNKGRAEEIATQQFNAAKKEQNQSEQAKGSFFRRKREKSHRRSKSLGKDHWEDLVWSESMSKFPAYERVSLRHPGFPRPVVIFGPVADLARERLLRDYPSKFACPQDSSSDDPSKNKSGIVRLSGIREVMDRRKHALLDVTPNAVDKLNYAQFYPIVIFVRADSKQTIKDCRTGVPKKAHMSSKKLFEQCQKLEKLWGHVFTGTLNLSNDNWYTKLTDLIDKQQTAPIWMSETKPDESFSDDFLFPMTSRLSYTSSPESDGEFCGDPETPKASRVLPEVGHDPEEGRLTRSNSDSNLVKEGDSGSIPNYNAPISCALENSKKAPILNGGGGTLKDQQSKYSGFRRTAPSNDSIDDLPLPPHPNNHSSSSTSSSSPQEGGKGPELPPKIDRHKKPHSRRGADESSSLDRNMHIRDMKMSAYDHNGGTIYDTYKSLDNEMVTQKNTLQDSSRRALSQDPTSTYRRQISGTSNGYDTAPKYNGNSQSNGGTNTNKSNGYDSKYRYADYKPVPPPKTASYKPIPPPKPKSYPRTQSQPPSIEGNYMNSGGPYYNAPYDEGSHVVNNNNNNSGGFDSGHGSSLDRGGGGDSYYNNNVNNNINTNLALMSGLNRQGGNPQQQQYYYPPNIPNGGGSNSSGSSGNNNSSPKRNGGDGLDLSNREYRGSAFELYKKPLSTCPPQAANQPLNNYFNGAHTTIGR